jgi:hypothetical protein
MPQAQSMVEGHHRLADGLPASAFENLGPVRASEVNHTAPTAISETDLDVPARNPLELTADGHDVGVLAPTDNEAGHRMAILGKDASK